MGREVRMVPKNWVHPVDERGNFIGLMEGPYSKSAAEWDEENAQWEDGLVLDWSKKERAFKPREETESETYEEYAGARPLPEEYMPEFSKDQCTHLMMYETTSEGTPLSPPMPDPESLARCLAFYKASAFGDDTATYEQWLRMVTVGYAPSAVFSASTGLMSGVAAS